MEFNSDTCSAQGFNICPPTGVFFSTVFFAKSAQNGKYLETREQRGSTWPEYNKDHDNVNLMSH